MRLLIDLPEGLARRIKELEFRGRYPSAEEFIWAAVENQLLLEEKGALVALTAGDDLGGRLLTRPSSTPQTVPAEQPTAAPLWGMINRFLPVKVGVRVLANLLADGGTDWVLLEEFERKAGAVAREYGIFLHDLDAKVGRKVEQRLSIGLPTGSKPVRSLSRYTQHFLAATPESALRKLGLAATSKNLVAEEVVGITEAGMKLTSLPNPALDGGDYTVSLSRDEAEFFKEQVCRSVRGEFDLWKEILELLGERGISQESLRAALKERKGWEGGTLAAMATGVLARMKELGLLQSRGRGPTALYESTGAPLPL